MTLNINDQIINIPQLALPNEGDLADRKQKMIHRRIKHPCINMGLLHNTVISLLWQIGSRFKF